jgi:hypothetical protein
MIITFAIITALLAATAPSAAFNRREYILSSNQEQLRSLISRAKALTMSGLLRPVVETDERICGYGISISQNDKTATIFSSILRTSPGDCPENASDFTSSINTSSINTVLLSEGALNKMTFDKGLEVSMTLESIPNNLSELDIYFIPPDPLTIITTGNKDSAVITLKLAPSERKIKINKAGLIDLIHGTNGE